MTSGNKVDKKEKKLTAALGSEFTHGEYKDGLPVPFLQLVPRPKQIAIVGALVGSCYLLLKGRPEWLLVAIALLAVALVRAMYLSAKQYKSAISHELSGLDGAAVVVSIRSHEDLRRYIDTARMLIATIFGLIFSLITSYF